MIDFSRLRLQNLFPFLSDGGGAQPQQISPEMFDQPLPSPLVQGQEPPNDPISMLQQIYQPRTKLSSMFTEELGKMPQREEPSKLRKFGSILAAAGAPAEHKRQIYEQTAYAPYNRKLGDWKQRIDTLMKGATEEDRYNLNQRMLALGTGNLSDKMTRTGIAERRATAYEFDKTHPDWKKETMPDGNLVYRNPKDPSQMYDTGIPTGLLTDEEKIAAQTQGRLQVAGKVGEESRKTAGVRGEESRKTEVVKGEQRRETKQTPGASAETPVQEKVRQYIRARQAILEHPEWAKHIKLDVNGANTFSVENPSTGHWFSSGPDEATHKAISDYITGSPSTGKFLTDPTGKKYDISTWSQKDIDEAKKRGFK